MIVRNAMHQCQVAIDPHGSLHEAVVTVETSKIDRLPVLWVPFWSVC